MKLVNAGVHPCIPAKGSVGASGDLAPLAHMTAVMIGVGEALTKSGRLPATEALASAGLQPIELQAKEGLDIGQILLATLHLLLEQALLGTKLVLRSLIPLVDSRHDVLERLVGSVVGLIVHRTLVGEALLGNGVVEGGIGL